MGLSLPFYNTHDVAGCELTNLMCAARSVIGDKKFSTHIPDCTSWIFILSLACYQKKPKKQALL